MRSRDCSRLLIAGLLVGVCFGQTTSSRKGVGIPWDWSHSHLVFNTAAADTDASSRRDPRILSALAARTATSRSTARVSKALPSKSKRQTLKRDWSVSLGSGRVAPTMSPAKFGFFTDTPLTTANCISDYVVYALDVPGTSSQANLVALNNLYSGTAPANNAGLCNPFTGGTNAATVHWAYNTSTATCGGGTCPTDGNKTSSAIAFDSTGSKIAFVESTSDANAVCPGRISPATSPCSIFHVLTWTANQGSIGAPATPGSMVSITYANAANTTSSPWIDYTNDVAYVGADDGNLYRITGVFNGTPTLDSSFTMAATSPAGAVQLSPPVQLSGTIPGPPATAFNILFIGDGSGNLWAIDVLRRSILGTTATPGTPAAIVVGGHKISSFIPGTLDAPLAYYDSVGDPSHIAVFATSSSSANTLHAAITNKAAVVEGLVELNAASPFGTFDDIAGSPLGLGATGTQFINLHAGAFNNTFYTTPTSGLAYFCGTQAAATWPLVYRFGFTNPLSSPRNLVPVLNSSPVGITAIAAFTSGTECSPLTEFANPNLSVTDILFLSDNGTDQRVYAYNITSTPTSIVIGGVAEPGGTSGIIVDNTQAFSGNGTSQGSSIYFTTLANGTSGTCNGVKCAVKLRQIDLQ